MNARAYFRMALACFVLAAGAGLLFRFAHAGYLNLGGLRLGDVRHAHSHLMFFGWATPVLMALITVKIARDSEQWGWRLTRLALAFGMLSFPAFLLWGYRPASLGPVDMPLGVITATLNMFVWYGFGWLWWCHRSRLPDSSARQLWDLAVAVLVVSTVGGWARGAFVGLGIDAPFWTAAAVHSFVDPFADGWLGAGTLGALYLITGTDAGSRARWATRLMAVGLLGSFLLGIPVDHVPPPVRTAGSVAGVALAGGLLLHVALLWTRTTSWRIRVPLAALGLKAGGLALAAIPPVARWAETNGLEIPYLHVFFLGFVTLALIEIARREWTAPSGRPATWPIYVGVAVLLVTLGPATGLWPDGWTAATRLSIVAWGAVPLTVAVGWLWGRFTVSRTHVANL